MARSKNKTKEEIEEIEDSEPDNIIEVNPMRPMIYNIEEKTVYSALLRIKKSYKILTVFDPNTKKSSVYRLIPIHE